MKISKKVSGVEYAIRDIVAAARVLEAGGRKVTYLNIGDPVQYGFGPPDNVKAALISAVQSGHNHYPPSEGLAELRHEIARKENRKGFDITGDDVIVTNGVSEALDMVMSSIIEDGDEVLLPGPYYPPYASYVRLHGGVPVEFAVDLQSSAPDYNDIRSKITPRTVAICLISPNNPTGIVFDTKSLATFVDIANEHGLYVICDEIYDQITYGKEFSGIGRVSGDSPVIILNGFSKVHLMTGWRVGYMAFNRSAGLDAIKEHLPKLARVRIATNMPFQYAALESLRGPQDYIRRFVSTLRERRDLVVRRLNEIPGISCPMPAGAFYAFPHIERNPYGTDREFVMRLLEDTGILAVHGSGFGNLYGSDHFRLVFLPGITTLESAMDGLEGFMRAAPA